MDDGKLLEHINHLVAEESQLREAGTTQAASAERLRTVEHQLDQCWDLLRQRRAKREFGQSPDQAALRDAGTVEGYTG